MYPWCTSLRLSLLNTGPLQCWAWRYSGLLVGAYQFVPYKHQHFILRSWSRDITSVVLLVECLKAVTCQNKPTLHIITLSSDIILFETPKYVPQLEVTVLASIYAKTKHICTSFKTFILKLGYLGTWVSDPRGHFCEMRGIFQKKHLINWHFRKGRL